MIIGAFTYDSASDTYTGDISTLNFQFSSVEIAPARKFGEKGPDYRLTFKTEHGEVELGAAWKRESDSGIRFLSISLDGPLMNTPLNAALFRDAKGKGASLVWARMKPQTEPKNIIKPKQTKKAA